MKKISILIVVLIAVFLLVGCQTSNQQNKGWQEWDSLTPSQRTTAEEITNVIGPCPCNQCSLTLTDCTCDHPQGALEIKTAIAEDIKSGKSKDDILEGLKEKYKLGDLEEAPELDISK